MYLTEAKVDGLFVNETRGGSASVFRDQYRVHPLMGIAGEIHDGFLKTADIRDQEQLSRRSLLPKGVEIRNRRQWTAVSVEELKIVAKNLEIPYIDPAWLGANIAFSEIDNLSKLPKGSLIFFHDNAILEVEEENSPCVVA